MIWYTLVYLYLYLFIFKDIIPVPKGFNPQKYCGERTYEYALPISALRPSIRNPKYNELSKDWEFQKSDIKKVFSIIWLDI